MTVDQVRTALRERIRRGASLEELDTMVRMTRGLSERQRAVLWSEAWRYDPRASTRRRVDAARAVLGTATRPLRTRRGRAAAPVRGRRARTGGATPS
jgi:hypothetical protein